MALYQSYDIPVVVTFDYYLFMLYNIFVTDQNHRRWNDDRRLYYNWWYNMTSEKNNRPYKYNYHLVYGWMYFLSHVHQLYIATYSDDQVYSCCTQESFLWVQDWVFYIWVLVFVTLSPKFKCIKFSL